MSTIANRQDKRLVWGRSLMCLPVANSSLCFLPLGVLNENLSFSLVHFAIHYYHCYVFSYFYNYMNDGYFYLNLLVLKGGNSGLIHLGSVANFLRSFINRKNDSHK